jgi:release factor glutamine methyltransferase
MTSIDAALKTASQMLEGVADRAMFEAEILLANILQCTRTDLILRANEHFDATKFFARVAKRAKHYPLEYITNEVSFYDTTLFVKEGVLIARPETEILVEKAIEIIRKNGYKKIAEIGVGSGAISTVVAKHCPDVSIVATDINQTALEVASTNIKNHALEDVITLKHTSLLEGVLGDFDMIISNPPYIAQDFILPKNVTFEPANALFGGKEGDELLKQIVILAQNKGAKVLLCEMGYDQKAPMQKFFEAAGISEYEFYKDLNAHDRGFLVYYKGKNDAN